MRKDVTLSVTFILKSLDRDEWDEAGFDADDYTDGHGGALDAVTAEQLAWALNDMDAETWRDFLNPLFLADESAGGTVVKAFFSPSSLNGQGDENV